DEERQAIVAQLAGHFPTDVRELNAELSQVLVYLQVPETTSKLVALLVAAPTQEEQIEYARALRMLTVGWTPELRKTYFEWFGRASGYRGGASFALFVQNIKNDALKTLSESERETLRPIIDAQPIESAQPQIAPARPLVKAWTMEELTPRLENGLKGRNFARGRTLFAAANCFACHRFDNEGGALGPDLTQLAGRFSPRDILESIMEPSKVISDQYSAVTITTDEGKVITGRVVNLSNEDLIVNTNMLEPNVTVKVEHRRIEQLVPSKVSMMPAGLLNTLQEDEILDLMAYLVSRGDRNHAMFK
ncbi:MAG: c-type cytochrome, partial [Planctomycetota bacterium]